MSSFTTTLREELDFSLRVRIHAYEFLEEQRRHNGFAYRLREEMSLLRDECLKVLVSGDDIADGQKELLSRYREVEELNLPEDIKERRLNECGKMIAECSLTKAFLPLILSDARLRIVPDVMELGISIPSYLVGLAVTPNILAGILEERLLEYGPKPVQAEMLRKRFIAVSRDIYEFLKRFEATDENVVNIAHGRNYYETFRGILGDLLRTIEGHENALSHDAAVGADFLAHPLKEELEDTLITFGAIDEALRNREQGLDIIHSLRKTVTRLTKDGMVALRSGQDTKEIELKMRLTYRALLDLDAPWNTKWEIRGQAAQEVVEYEYVKALYPALFSGAELGNLPSPADMGVTLQDFLNGLCDVPGELGKMAQEHRATTDACQDDRRSLETRLLEIAREIYEALKEYYTVYPLVISNTRRYARNNSYAQRVERVENLMRNLQRRAIGQRYARQ